MSKLEILVTNDDGIKAPGIQRLARLMKEFGNVTVVAPKEPQSGKSTSFTMDNVLRLEKISEEDSLRMFSFTGTPVDCTKMGINLMLEDGHLPDLIVSGINHGSNASAASMYSGTLGATREAAVYGIPSIGFSVDSHDISFPLDTAVEKSRIVVEKVLAHGMRKGSFLNVNIPAIAGNKILGFRTARQGEGRWIREFEKRTDPRGKEYYWIVGEFLDLSDESDSAAGGPDHALVKKGWITICPMTIDTTDYAELERIKDIWDH